MRTIQLNGITLEVDETLTYHDFFRDGEYNRLFTIDFAELLEDMAKEPWTEDLAANLRGFLHLIKRWLHDGPRKKICRGLLKEGMYVMTSDELFMEREDGDDIVKASVIRANWLNTSLRRWDGIPHERIPPSSDGLAKDVGQL